MLLPITLVCCLSTNKELFFSSKKMIMKILKLVLWISFMAQMTFAQHVHPEILCGYDLLKEQMERQYPGFQEHTDAVFEAAKRKGAASRLTRGGEIYKIPVVVHVVWKENEENIPDSAIYSQIAVLNEDFRRLNADADNVRGEFESVVGDPMIEFDLVEIIRVETAVEFRPSLTGLPDEVKRTFDGGSDAWDTESYLNIWVCHLRPLSFGGIDIGLVLGYAYPPADLPNWPDGASAPTPEVDGVVIDYRVFGRNSPHQILVPTTNQPIITKGRTPVHEIGHYLGLRHIWGDGGGLLGGSSCGEDDGVEDTPNSGGQAEWACDYTRNTCVDAMGDLPDMIENYMDYASENCMNSFTQGQIDIMRGVLEGPRCGLLNNCDPLAVSTLSTKALRLFPNPTREEVYLELNSQKLEDYTLRVRTLLGQIVPVVVSADKRSISFAGLPKGIYLVELANVKERMLGKVVVK